MESFSLAMVKAEVWFSRAIMKSISHSVQSVKENANSDLLMLSLTGTSPLMSTSKEVALSFRFLYKWVILLKTKSNKKHTESHQKRSDILI